MYTSSACHVPVGSVVFGTHFMSLRNYTTSNLFCSHLRENPRETGASKCLSKRRSHVPLFLLFLPLIFLGLGAPPPQSSPANQSNQLVCRRDREVQTLPRLIGMANSLFVCVYSGFVEDPQTGGPTSSSSEAVFCLPHQMAPCLHTL